MNKEFKKDDPKALCVIINKINDYRFIVSDEYDRIWIVLNDFGLHHPTNDKDYNVGDFIVICKYSITRDFFNINAGIHSPIEWRYIDNIIERLSVFIDNVEKYTPVTNNKAVESLYKYFNLKKKDSDEIYYFSTDEGSWNHLYGREGYIIIQDNKPYIKILALN